MGIFSRGGKGGPGKGVDYPPKDQDDKKRGMSVEEIRGLGEPWPPEEPVEGHQQDPSVEAEPLFRPRPEQRLSIESLVEKAREGEPLAMVEELDQYYDAWVHYAQDRNIFNGSASIKALAQARREAIKLASDKNYDALRAKLEELSGTVVRNVETAAEENIRHIQSGKESTTAENRKDWEEVKSNVLDLESERSKTEEEKTVGEPDLLLSRKEDVRHLEREAKAERFAEKYGLTAERAAMLAAEEEYVAAIRNRNSSFSKFKFRDEAATKEQHEKFVQAIHRWREAAANAALGHGDKQDIITARFISARDAMIRTERVRQDAVAEGLDARSKTTLGKLDGWAQSINKKTLQTLAVGGEGFKKASEKVGGVLGGKLVGLFVDKEKNAEKYKRATRILGSAAIMTAIFAPLGAVTAGAAGAAFVWRVARGLGGWGLGSAAGVVAGKFHDALHFSKEDRTAWHESDRENLQQTLKGTWDPNELFSLTSKELTALYKRGSATEFKKQEEKLEASRARTQLVATTLVAGASAYGLSHLPAVHDAFATVNHHHDPQDSQHPASKPLVHPRAAHADAVVKPGKGISHALKSLNHDPDHAENIAKPGKGIAHALNSLNRTSHTETASGLHGAAHSTHEAAAPAANASAHIESVKVGGHVNNADRLFGRFVDNIKHQYPDPEHAPPALKELLKHSHAEHGMKAEDVLTKFLHLQDGVSVKVHPGDTVSFEGGKVVFQGHTLIDEQGKLHEIHPHAQAPTHPEHKPHVTHATHAPQHPHEPASKAAPEHLQHKVPVQTAPAAEPIAHADQPHFTTEKIEIRGNVVPIRPGIVIPGHEDVPVSNGSVESHIPSHAPVIEHHEATARPMPQASNDNVPHTELPSAPAEHIITNHFGTKIDTSVPHIYAPEGTDEQVYILYGGTPEQRLAFLDKYFKDPEYAGHPVLTPAINPADPTGKQVLVVYGMNANQDQIIPAPATDPKGKPLFFKGVEEFESIIL